MRLGAPHFNNNEDLRSYPKGPSHCCSSTTPTNSFTALPSIRFGELLEGAFKRTAELEYLNESISTRRQILELPRIVPALRFKILHYLSMSLAISYQFLSQFNLHLYSRDLDEALVILSQCANNRHRFWPVQFLLACKWATIARLTQHPTISTAYETALSFMQESRHPSFCTNVAATTCHSHRVRRFS